MNDLHDKLVSKDGWYAFWHIQKYHKHINWIVFGMVAIIFTGLLSGEIQKPGFIKNLFTQASASTYYVRNGGGTTAQCNGLVNTDYTGSTQNCALKNLQDAINKATFGDTIKLAAGQNFDTPDRFVSFNLTNKGTPPTGTDADYITITSDDPTGTPSALSNYPASDTRITTAMAARMPKVRSSSDYGFPAFWINPGSKFWRVERLDITNTPTSKGIIRLIGNGEYYPPSRDTFPDHITFQLNWIHPKEETGAPMDDSNVARTVDNAMYVEGTNIVIRQNAMQGFAGRYQNSDGSLGSPMTTSNLLMTTWADNVLLENNLLEAWTYATFFGGGNNLPDPSKIAVVSGCTSLSCSFSNTNGLGVGDPVAVKVYSYTDPGGVFREVYGSTFVQSINGSFVTFKAPLCHSNNDPGGNTCKPFTSSNSPSQIPSDGNEAVWEGYQVQNVLVRRNIFAHRPEWTTYLGQSAGKGYLELKSCHNCTYDGNIFKGSTGPTITTRNQGGSDPWNDLDNLTFSNNFFMNGNSPFTAYLQDGANLTSKSRNVTFYNNLVVGRLTEPAYAYDAKLSGNFSGGVNVTVSHNTALISDFRDFVSFAPNTMDGLNIRDNIFRFAPNQCFDFSSGSEQGAPINTCWPGASVNKNVIVNIDNKPLSEINSSWLTPYPNNFLASSAAAVGFTNAPASLDATGNYRLATNSPYKNAATDGKDIGVDIDQLNNAIYGNSAPPPPSPTDTTPPSVNLTAPTSGANLSGTITMSANASDNVGVSRVDFYVDGTLKSSDTSSPYSASFDTITVSNGSHSFQAKAFDTSGNMGTSSVVLANVNNQVTTAKTHLVLNPAILSFIATSGGATPAAKTSSLSNTGTVSSSWSTSANQNWCHVSPSSGSITAGGSTSLSITVDAPSNVGTFTCNISISDSNADNSPQTLSVTYTVSSGTPPPPSGQYSLSGSTLLSLGGPFNYTVVYLYDSNRSEITHIQEQNSSYSFNVAAGSYILKVVQDGYNTNPSEIVVNNVCQNISGLDFTLGPNSNYPSGPVRTVIGCSTQNKSHLSLSSSSLSFSGVSGDIAPAAKTVVLSNTGTASSSWSSSSSQDWCHISPSSGTLAAGGSTNLSVSVDEPSNVGTFSCSITVSDSNADNSPQTISVSYTVNPVPTPATTPSITSFSVSSKTATTVTIKWTTSQPTAGVVKYGTSKANLSLSKADSTSTTSHTLTLTGLAAGTTYYYQISASNSGGTATSIISNFRTKPK